MAITMTGAVRRVREKYRFPPRETFVGRIAAMVDKVINIMVTMAFPDTIVLALTKEIVARRWLSDDDSDRLFWQ